MSDIMNFRTAPLLLLSSLLALWLLALPAHAKLYSEFQPPLGARVGIFMGTFDPPHNSHHNLMEAAIKGSNLDYVIIIPNDAPLHKPNAYDVQVRQTMLRSLYESHPKIVVPDLAPEMWDGKMRLSIIRQLRESGKELKLVGIYGTDILQDNLKNKAARKAFRKKFDELFVATNRKGMDRGNLVIPERLWDLPTNYANYEDAGTSSTKIRNYIRANPQFLEQPLTDEAAERIAKELGLQVPTLRDIHRLQLYAKVEPRSCQWFWTRVGNIFEGK